MKELVIMLFTWISANTSYDVNHPQPNIVLTTRHNLCQLYGIHDFDTCNASGLRAFYDKDLTIYMGIDFDESDSHKISGLLHELTHYIQYRNNRHDNTCLGHLELEAYKVQDAWRAEQGLEPVLDIFNEILLEDSCSA
ncbi:MAG: hypothetical protein MI673_00845 [Thiotrichales bacterium]|nr:hypothetical protein [Thiotrichales bacterium]